MHALRASIDRVAATDFTVLLEGESGVGKELVARQIHESSRRRQGPFVAVNCAALVETLVEAELFGIEERTATGVRGRRGKFEHADGGTLFLDEVSDLSLSAQAKLLRAIQDLSVERVGGTGSHRVDIRVVAATNKNLANLVERRLFRADLYYRLSGVDLRIPALRERRADVPLLVEHFLEAHRSMRRLRLSPSAMDALVIYDWPGNVRELERLIERAVALAEADTIELDDLPPAVRGDYEDAVLPSVRQQRHAAGLGLSIRAAHSRTLPRKQARSLSRPRDQLSHTAGVPADAVASPRGRNHGSNRCRECEGRGRGAGRDHDRTDSAFRRAWRSTSDRRAAADTPHGPGTSG